MKELRIGILSTARITNRSLIKPAQQFKNIKISAVASRKWRKAKIYALTHKIPKAYGSYEKLINDPKIDAIYNPLPNSMHAEWTIKALIKGKHVLCEKPIASNASEAIEMNKIAINEERCLMEAFHFRYHPLALRISEIVTKGIIGEVKSIYSAFCINVRDKTNIRYQYNLAGGGIMDVGCYCVSILRMIAKSEPKVVSSEAIVVVDQIDDYIRSELIFPGGIKGVIECSLATNQGKSGLEIIGTKGKIICDGPFDSNGNIIKISVQGNSYTEDLRDKSTYYFQLKAFYDYIFNKIPAITDGMDAIANMKVIDDMYIKAGLKPRGT